MARLDPFSFPSFPQGRNPKDPGSRGSLDSPEFIGEDPGESSRTAGSPRRKPRLCQTRVHNIGSDQTILLGFHELHTVAAQDCDCHATTQSWLMLVRCGLQNYGGNKCCKKAFQKNNKRSPPPTPPPLLTPYATARPPCTQLPPSSPATKPTSAPSSPAHPGPPPSPDLDDGRCSFCCFLCRAIRDTEPTRLHLSPSPVRLVRPVLRRSIP